MNSTKSTRIERFFTKLSVRFVYLIALFVFFEIFSGFALKLYYDFRHGSTDYSFAGDARKELEKVQEDATLNVYRWYANKPNYSGKFVVTDQSGFRINNLNLDDRSQVGMFGGSTTFSILTDQDGTIANLLSKSLNDHQILNFGVGGYSTSAEIMTLVEAIRSYPDMKTAVFYDGVNELGRAIGDYGTVNHSYQLLGYPYKFAVNAAIVKESGNFLSWQFKHSNMFYIYDRIISKINLSRNFPIEKVLNEVVERYFLNLKVINGICAEHGIKCIYTWQPSVFNVQDGSLSDKEIEIKNSTPRSYYLLLTKLIFLDERSTDFNVINLASALDKKSKSQTVFQDWSHLSADGNMYIANALRDVFIKLFY